MGRPDSEMLQDSSTASGSSSDASLSPPETKGVLNLDVVFSPRPRRVEGVAPDQLSLYSRGGVISCDGGGDVAQDAEMNRIVTKR